MTYLEALETEVDHIVNWVDTYDKEDIEEKLQSLKVYMLACSEGYGNEDVNTID